MWKTGDGWTVVTHNEDDLEFFTRGMTAFATLRDTTTVQFRKYFYTLVIHGGVARVEGDHPAEQVATMLTYHKWGTDKPGLLLLSCLTGLGLALKLSRSLGKPVLAPTWDTALGPRGDIIQMKDSEMEKQKDVLNLPNAAWRFFRPTGEYATIQQSSLNDTVKTMAVFLLTGKETGTPVLQV
jgi:hypothetical protein